MKEYKGQVESIVNKVAGNLNIEVLNLQYVHNPFSPYFKVELSSGLIILVGELNIEFGTPKKSFTIDYDFEFSGLINEDAMSYIVNEITTKVGDMT